MIGVTTVCVGGFTVVVIPAATVVTVPAAALFIRIAEELAAATCNALALVVETFAAAVTVSLFSRIISPAVPDLPSFLRGPCILYYDTTI